MKIVEGLRKGLILMILLITGGVISGAVYGSREGRFILEYGSQQPSVRISGVGVVIPTIEFYFSKPGWLGTVHKVDFSRSHPQKKYIRGGYLLKIKKKLKNKGIEYSIGIVVKAHVIDIEYYYKIYSGSEVGYCVFDIFLDKGLFYKARRKGRGRKVKDEFNSFGEYDEIEFETEVGRFRFKLDTEDIDKDGISSRWKLRDVKHRASCELRTLSILNSFKREGDKTIEQKLHARIEFYSPKDIKKKIAARNVLKLVEVLKDIGKGIGTGDRIKELELESKKMLGGKSDISVKEIESKAEDIAKEILAEKRREREKLEPVIIPSPQRYIEMGGEYEIKEGTKVGIRGKDKSIRIAGERLREELKRYWGVGVELVDGGRGSIELGISKDAVGGGEEGYRVYVGRYKVEIEGNSGIGVLWGVETFLQLLHKDKNARIIARCCKIEDWPDIKWRGIMFSLPINSVELLKRLIDRVVIRYKFNHLVLSNTIRWKSHPEIAVGYAMDVEDVRKVVKYAKRYGLEVIPALECFGHSRNIIKAYPEFADDPRGRGKSICVGDERVRKLVRDIFDEAIDVFEHPRYFHICMDEVDSIGRNPIYKGKKAEDIFAEYIKWCYEYLRDKGVKDVIMWHDMLLEHGVWKKVPANSCKKFGGFSKPIGSTHHSISKLPKDIIIAVWSYWNTGSFPSIGYFQKWGYRVIGCPWFKERNNYDMAFNVYKEHALGILATSWGFFWGGRAGICISPGLTSIIVEENAWTVGKPKFEEIRYSSSEEIQKVLLPPRPSQWAGTRCEVVDISRWCNRSLRDEIAGDGKGWIDQGKWEDMRLIPEGKNRFKGVDFYIIPHKQNGGRQCIAVGKGRISKRLGIPNEVKGIKIGGKVKSIVFLHTTYPFRSRKEKLGSYKIIYEDGEEEEIKLVNKDNIIGFRKDIPPVYPTTDEVNKRKARYLGGAQNGWEGINLRGEHVDVQEFEWRNPREDKEVKEIDIKAEKSGQIIFLLGISVVR